MHSSQHASASTAVAPGPGRSRSIRERGEGHAVLVAGLSRARADRGGTAPRWPANDGVDLTIARGQVFGLLGPNGAGKTTLLRQLAGVLRPDSGRIELLGHDVVARPGIAPLLMAYLAQQEPALDDLPVAVALETTARLRGLSRRAARAATDAVIDELSLDALAGRALSALSGGQRRLAQLGAALVADRPLLLLDEPTAGLDPAARKVVWDALRRRAPAATVVVVTHDTAEAGAVLDQVAVMRRGRVTAAGPAPLAQPARAADTCLVVTWRTLPPADDPIVTRLRQQTLADGLQWSARMEPAAARRLLADLLQGPAAGCLAGAALIADEADAVREAPARPAAHGSGRPR